MDITLLIGLAVILVGLILKVDVLLLITLAVIVGGLIVLGRLDADPVLSLYEKFGKSPACMAGKVVWITGASGGIGEYLAYELAKNGCKLVLSARRTAELERVKKECLAKSSLTEADIMILPLDVMNLDEHPQHVEAVLKYFKKIDVLVNNAGRSQRSWFIDTPVAVDQDMFMLNVISVISLTKAVLPHMVEMKQGQIVVISSTAGKMGLPFSATYSATKHALQGLFFGLQAELTEKNIDIALICPGPVRSGVMKNAFTSKPGEAYGIDMPEKSSHMATSRCAHLTAVAMANRLLEVWISPQPALMFASLAYHFPVFMTRLLQLVGMKRFLKMREAGSKTPLDK